MNGSTSWEGEQVKDVVPRLGMKGSKSLGRRTGQRFCSKTWDEGFKEFGKENGSKTLFTDLA